MIFSNFKIHRALVYTLVQCTALRFMSCCTCLLINSPILSPSEREAIVIVPAAAEQRRPNVDGLEKCFGLNLEFQKISSHDSLDHAHNPASLGFKQMRDSHGNLFQ